MSVSELATTSTDEAATTVRGLWRALSNRDWERVKTYLAAESLYIDVPTGPTLAARGPDDIVKRLKIGIEPLAGYENYDGLLLSNGTDVFFEHSERWLWATGETALLKFVSVLAVVDGKVTVWKDYWDMAGLTAHAPPTWMDDLMASDMSWIYDATGQI